MTSIWLGSPYDLSFGVAENPSIVGGDAPPCCDILLPWDEIIARQGIRGGMALWGKSAVGEHRLLQASFRTRRSSPLLRSGVGRSCRRHGLVPLPRQQG
jgi:hypothetical protein